MLDGFLRKQGDVRAAEDDRHPTRAEMPRNLIGMVGAGSVEGNADQVCLNVKIHRADLFIYMFHLPIGRGESRQVGHGDLLKIEETRPANLVNFW